MIWTIHTFFMEIVQRRKKPSFYERSESKPKDFICKFHPSVINNHKIDHKINDEKGKGLFSSKDKNL